MQLCRIVYYSLAALHVSSDTFVHHQEHLNCITASGITHVCLCRLVSWEFWKHANRTSMTNTYCVYSVEILLMMNSELVRNM
jgi:hypothetical protein